MAAAFDTTHALALWPPPQPVAALVVKEGVENKNRKNLSKFLIMHYF